MQNALYRYSYFLVGVLFLVMTFIVFGQNFSEPYIPWDDDRNIWKNYILTNGSSIDLFKEPIYGMYIPLTYSYWKFLLFIGDSSPDIFRFLNISLHFFNSILLLLITKVWVERYFNQKFKLDAICIFLILIFLFHPVQVEVVAWISGGRDLLSFFFAILAMIVMLKYPKQILLPSLLFVYLS